MTDAKIRTIRKIPEIEAVLAAAAFGSKPGTWPLPSPATPYQSWLRAIAAGGQGRYASATSDLAVLLRGRPDPALASLAHSTRASFVRQLGWHELARGWDGRAVALAGASPEARTDALIGLAADALGVGRFAASARLLARVAEAPEAVDPLPRLAVRRAWVAAELAMSTGDGPAAVRHAEQAVELSRAAGTGLARHRLKSEVVLAAALCCAGRIDRAQRVADPALDTAETLGLVPLRWALACLLADIGSATRSAEQLGAIRDASAELVERRGGRWRRR